MSRHVIPNAPGSPAGRMTVVGWDASLNTFFANAFDPPPVEDDDEVIVFDLGSSPCELPTLDDLIKALAEHGVQVPPAVVEELDGAREAEGEQFCNLPTRHLVAAYAVGRVGPEQMRRIQAALDAFDSRGGAR